MQYWTCPLCGANLDMNEKCDCEKEQLKKQEFFNRHLKIESGTGQLAFVFQDMEDSYEKKMHI